MRTRHTYQRGYVSEGFKTRRGIAYRIRYRVPTAKGKWKHKSEVLYDLSGRKAARDVLNSRLQEVLKRTPEAAELSVEDFVRAYWKPYLERRSVKPSTRKGYESVLNTHIFPFLGDVKLTEVVPLQIEELLRSKARNGLSAKTIRNIVVLLKGIFSLAEDNDLIARTPVRKRHKPNITRTEKPSWTPQQVRSIIDTVPAQYRPLFVCAALTGLRLGELLGLQWRHIDFSCAKLRIEQSLWNGQLVSPKTKNSIRTIPFGEVLGQTLACHRQNSLHVQPENFVFAKSDGSPLQPDLLRRDVLYPALDRLQISRSARSAGFHTFRHSAGSFINAETGNLKLAQKLLGHSNLSTTADIYTHTSAEAERDAAMAVERAIYGNLFPIVPKTGNRNSQTATM
jgi:integrase